MTDDEMWVIHAQCYTDTERGHSDVATYDFADACYKKGYEDALLAHGVTACVNMPIAEVRIEPDYWSRGHFYEGRQKQLRVIGDLMELPIGTKLYATPGVVEALRPCRSPYCECDQGKCTHSGFYDARDND